MGTGEIAGCCNATLTSQNFPGITHQALSMGVTGLSHAHVQLLWDSCECGCASGDPEDALRMIKTIIFCSKRTNYP